MAAAAITSTAATAIYKYTYTLGRSLYVPLTSRCNSVPLPVTRGPGFQLPRTVAETLVRVRNADVPGSVRSDLYDDWLEDERVELPPYNIPLVDGLYDHGGDDLPRHLERQRQIARKARDDGEQHLLDDLLQPSISTLVEELSSRLDNSTDFDQVVIAGEGEPTLRMDALLAVARSVEPYRTKNNDDAKRRQKQPHQNSSLPVRVITNGLCYGIPNLGYSPHNRKRNGVIVPMHRHVMLRDMMDAGISGLSVALNTANRHEYDLLMEPCCHTGGGTMFASGDKDDGGYFDVEKDDDGPTLMPGTAHDIVCELILEARKLGMDVEITVIDRPGIDKAEIERLARMLLSVSSNYKLKKMVRWRKYFD